MIEDLIKIWMICHFYVSYSQNDVTETIIKAFTSKRNDTYKWMINKYGLTESEKLQST